jgi:hypothetical protein
MTTILTSRRSKFGMICVQCSNELIAPEWSEHRNERHVRHRWHCWKCDFRFESVVSFPALSESMKDIKTLSMRHCSRHCSSHRAVWTRAHHASHRLLTRSGHIE